jgi:HlyD family secretion protein
MQKKTKWSVVLTAAALLALAGLFALRRGSSGISVDVGEVSPRAVFRSTVTASGEIVAARYADIGASAMGRIVKLNVSEGQRVRAGQTLAQIDAVQSASDREAAVALVRALEAEEASAGQQVRAARAALDSARARASEADKNRARQRQLQRDGLTTVADLEAAEANADAAVAQADAAQASAEMSEQGREAASRRVAQARAQLTRATDSWQKTTIVSPLDGIVSRLRVREGEMVVTGVQNQPGTTLMTISDLAGLNAEVKVAEADVLRVALGQPAQVSLEAAPGRGFSGRVTEIGASALPVSDSGAAAREFRVVVQLDQPDPGLRPGLTCDAEIITSERAHVLTVPLQAVVLRRPAGVDADRPGLFVVENGRARFTPVTTGVIGGLDVEVSGVPEGTPVVIGPYQTLRGLADGAAVRRAGR